jgi:L-ornithine Nalpha-acyltransferase
MITASGSRASDPVAPDPGKSVRSISLPGDAGFGELRAGNLGVRIATSDAEIRAVQALRYRVFYHEMGAHPDPATFASKLDADQYDAVADHLLVIDHSIGAGPDSIVGTYRLIRRAAAARIGRFYSSSEFDISMMEAFAGEVLELGRSCVALEYRSRAVMQLLWSGIAAYVFRHRIDLMFGCASLPGTDPDVLGPELTYLYYHHLAPPAIRPRALPDLYVDMRRVDPASLGDPRRALAALPPLVKGYLRLGGFVGDGAVIDRQFNTTDVAVVVKTDLVAAKYHRHFERDRRDAAEFDHPDPTETE